MTTDRAGVCSLISGPPRPPRGSMGRPRPRSEEHTSELQSLTNLVCRLVLEKKKTKNADPRGRSGTDQARSVRRVDKHQRNDVSGTEPQPLTDGSYPDRKQHIQSVHIDGLG